MDFPSSIIGSILEKLGPYAYQHIVSAWGFKEEFNRLKETLEDIQSVLKEAEEKQEKQDDIRLWLDRLRDVLHDVKDVIDEFEIQDQQRQIVNNPTQSSQTNKFHNLSLSLGSITLRFKLSQQIGKIFKRLNEIQQSKKAFSFIKQSEGIQVMRKRDAHSGVDVHTVMGRDADKEAIIEKLMASAGNLSVISIVGLGVVGKTTLAKLVYSDERVVFEFPLRMWVCVSYEFEVKTLAKEILKQATRLVLVSRDDPTLESLRMELQTALQGRKFLLVLDDVWNQDRGKWEQLMELLSGGIGSKIIVTTRSKLVSGVINRQKGYELSHLSDDICFSLFLRSAGIQGDEEAKHPNLINIGQKIVSKCAGNPLAAKTLGSVLYPTTNEDDWLRIRDNDIWKLETRGEDDIMPALRLSYNQMPTYLKPCFAYCALFPKAFKFNSVDLIQLWSANGLIQSDGNQEDVGLQYLQELFGRCFFEDIEERVFIHSFKMHDLIHDLSRLVATEFIMLGTKTVGDFKKGRHLSIVHDGLFDQVMGKFPYLERRLRSIVCPITLSEPIKESNIGNFILNCKYLWVLDLSSSSFEKLPNSIGCLKHLRYFSLSGNRRIKTLPASICKLVKLQVLGLGGCKKLENLPQGIGKMINLRVLEFTTKQEQLGIGSLSSLQVLFISRCQSLKSLFDDMSSLTSLRTLSIVDCHQLRRLPCSVNRLTALENLLIANCGDLDLMMIDEDQTRSFEPFVRANLRTVTITKLRTMKTLPEWLQNSATTLRCLIIEDCPGFTKLPGWLQSFTSLHKLHIRGCPRFKAETMKDKIALVQDVYFEKSIPP